MQAKFAPSIAAPNVTRMTVALLRLHRPTVGFSHEPSRGRASQLVLACGRVARCDIVGLLFYEGNHGGGAGTFIGAGRASHSRAFVPTEYAERVLSVWPRL